jgi:hypothetical protein
MDDEAQITALSRWSREPQAARARRWAEHLMGDEAEERLQKQADEHEAAAAEIEQSQPTSPELP